MTPSQYEQDVEWVSPEIEGSTRTIDPPSAKGPTVRVKYKGLPANSDQFGPKTIQAAVNIGGCQAEDAGKVNIFYLRDADNNPGGRVPNWFYYWKQTPAAKPRRQPVNIEYGGSAYNECVNPKVPAQYTQGAGHATIHICDLSRLGPNLQNRTPILSTASPYHLGWEIPRK